MPQDTISGLRKPLSGTENSLTHTPNEIITEPNYKVQGPHKSNTLPVSKNSVTPPTLILLSVTVVSKENQRSLLKARQLIKYSRKVHYIRCNVRRKTLKRTEMRLLSPSCDSNCSKAEGLRMEK
jgi:hypothetical protein